MLPLMQVGLFFLRARRIRNLLRTMMPEAGRAPAPRMPLREMFQRRSENGFSSPALSRGIHISGGAAPSPGKGVDTAIPSCYFSTAENFLHSHHARTHGKPPPCHSFG